jgi:lipopolysaccharide export LptBFGC system permease protein LptF
MTRPGRLLRRLAALICRPETIERISDPILADLQHEDDAAVRDGHQWRRRWMRCRGYAAFWQAMAMQAGHSLVRGYRESIRPDGWLLARTLTCATAAFVALTLLITSIPFFQWPARPGGVNPFLLFLTLIPQALPLTIPAAVCIAVLWSLRGRAASTALAALFLALAGIACVMVWTTLEWLIPDANQAFRELFAGGVLVRGLGELSLSELGARTDPQSVRLYHVRVALCFATLAATCCAMAIAPLVRGRVAAAFAGVLVNMAVLIVLGILFDGPVHPRSVQPTVWLAGVVSALASVLLVSVAASSRRFRRS